MNFCGILFFSCNSAGAGVGWFMNIWTSHAYMLVMWMASTMSVYGKLCKGAAVGYYSSRQSRSCYRSGPVNHPPWAHATLQCDFTAPSTEIEKWSFFLRPMSLSWTCNLLVSLKRGRVPWRDFWAWASGGLAHLLLLFWNVAASLLKSGLLLWRAGETWSERLSRQPAGAARPENEALLDQLVPVKS